MSSPHLLSILSLAVVCACCLIYLDLVKRSLTSRIEKLYLSVLFGGIFLIKLAADVNFYFALTLTYILSCTMAYFCVVSLRHRAK